MTDSVVLIADPDAAARERFELAFARAGFSVASATDGTSALRLATRLVPDNLLTEILLPNLDGFHLAQRLRRQAKTAHMGIVAVTTYDGDDLRQRASDSGIDAVLRKTRSMHDIIRAVRAASRNNRELLEQSAILREEMDVQLDRQRELQARASDVLTESRRVAAEIARAVGGDEQLAREAMLGEADGARDVMIVDPPRGEALFQMLFERHGDDPLLHYKRGEAYRAAGRRKLAHREFAFAAERLANGVWRDRARFAAEERETQGERRSPFPAPSA